MYNHIFYLPGNFWNHFLGKKNVLNLLKKVLYTKLRRKYEKKKKLPISFPSVECKHNAMLD